MKVPRAGITRREAGAAQGLLILVASALPVMGVVLLSPVAQRLPQEVGTGPGGISLAPLVLTAPALAIALFSPVGGYLLDIIGRRICFLTALFIYALLGAAPLWLDNPYLIIVSRFGLGMMEAIILASTIALVADYFSGATRDRWIASMMAVAAFAGTLFYITGGFLGSISWKAPFVAYGIAAVIFLAAIPTIFEPRAARAEDAVAPSARRSGQPRSPSRALAAILTATFVGSMFFYVVPLQLGRFLEARGVTSSSTIGLLIALAGLGNPIGSFSFRHLRTAPFAVLLGGSTALSGLGLLLAALWPGAPALVFGAFINQLGCGMLCPLTMAAILRIAPAHRRGASGGGWSTAFFVGQFFSPMAALPLMALDRTGDGVRPLAVANLLYAGAAFWLLAGIKFGSAEARDHGGEADGGRVRGTARTIEVEAGP